MCSRQLVADDLGFGCFKRPGEVMNVANQDLASKGSEEAITLSQKVFQRAGCARMWNRAETAIACFEAHVPGIPGIPRAPGVPGIRGYEKASAHVVSHVAAQKLSAHAGIEIRKMEDGSGS